MRMALVRMEDNYYASITINKNDADIQIEALRTELKRMAKMIEAAGGTGSGIRQKAIDLGKLKIELQRNVVTSLEEIIPYLLNQMADRYLDYSVLEGRLNLSALETDLAMRDRNKQANISVGPNEIKVGLLNKRYLEQLSILTGNAGSEDIDFGQRDLLLTFDGIASEIMQANRDTIVNKIESEIMKNLEKGGA